MDFEAREVTWSGLTANVFSDSRSGPGQLGSDSVYRDLLSSHKEATKLWWNIKSLEEHGKHNLIPRGLRIQILPSWEVDDQFKSTWERGLTQCSRTLIGMLIEHDKELLSRTKTHIRP